jgi:Tol biopolymer transport system component
MPAAGLAWTPDGRFLLFATGPLAPGLLVVPAEARDATHLQRLDVAGFNVNDPSIIGRNGGREVDLAYAQKGTNWDILGASIGRDASAPATLAGSSRPDDAPSFSPDGKQIAFSSSRTGYQEIWVALADGAMPRQLTHFASTVTTSPRWSPDGRWIAFEAVVDDNPDIYRVRSDGGAPVRMTSEPSTDVQPSWSHDGRWLYFMSDRGGSKQIWKTPVEGGRAVQVTRQGGYQAFESDDGRYVYYAKQQHRPGIWRVPVNGGPETSFSDDPYDNFWTLAGGGVYYLDVKARIPQLFAISGPVPVRRIDLAANKTTTVATVEASFPGGVSVIDVTRDGRHLAWVSWRDRTTELMLIRNLHIAP